MVRSVVVLPGAVRAEQRDDLAGEDLQRDPLERVDVAVVGVDVVRPQERLAAGAVGAAAGAPAVGGHALAPFPR